MSQVYSKVIQLYIYICILFQILFPYGLSQNIEFPLLYSTSLLVIYFIYSSWYKLILFFFFNLFLAALGLCCCKRVFSSCGEQGLLFVAVHGFLIAVASLVAEHGL